MLSKILTAVYEVENEFDENSTTKGRKNRGDSWEMNGMVIDVCFTSLLPY